MVIIKYIINYSIVGLDSILSLSNSVVGLP